MADIFSRSEDASSAIDDTRLVCCLLGKTELSMLLHLRGMLAIHGAPLPPDAEIVRIIPVGPPPHAYWFVDIRSRAFDPVPARRTPPYHGAMMAYITDLDRAPEKALSELPANTVPPAVDLPDTRPDPPGALVIDPPPGAGACFADFADQKLTFWFASGEFMAQYVDPSSPAPESDPQSSEFWGAVGQLFKDKGCSDLGAIKAAAPYGATQLPDIGALVERARDNPDKDTSSMEDGALKTWHDLPPLL